MKNSIVVSTRNAMIGFFVLIFIMGFFSKSIVNLFLPKVIVESAVDGLIEKTLKVEGMIEPVKSHKVRLSGDVILEEYFVKEGDLVEVGKPLFRIDKGFGIKSSSLELEELKLQLEAKSLSLDNLKQASYEIDQKNIDAMERKLVKSNEELAKQQQLFVAGAISKQELETFEADLEQLLFEIEVAKLQLQEKKSNDEATIKDLANEIRIDELQILELQEQKGFYGNIDHEGKYYSSEKGVVINLCGTQSLIPSASVLLEIADISKGDALLYTANITQEDYNFAKSTGVVQILGESVKDNVYLKISSINKLDEKGQYRLVAAIENQSIKSVAIGQRLKGVIKQKYVMQGHNKVPKAAVINFEGYKEGSTGIVYLLEENEGILGMEYRAKEMEIKILAQGDDDVIVSGLENLEEPEVIVNLSYKVKDGTKVFLWQ